MRVLLSLIAVLTLSAGTAPSAVSAASSPAPEKQLSGQGNPFVGLWKANLSKSKRDPSHQFERATLRFDVDGDSVTLTHGGINASGHEESGVTTLLADGKEHALPEAPAMLVTTRWLDSRVLETVVRKDGEIAARGVYEVSADGKTLTATVSGTDAGGRDFQQVIVFDRE